MTTEQSIYDQIGGTPAITVVVSDFYQLVLADDALAGKFDGVDLERLEKRQVEFFAAALGGPDPYTGASMKNVHRHLGITTEQFGLVAGHLADALLAAGVPRATTDEIIGAIAGLADDIVTA
ncbi:group 1 truncated hemoglobin [Nocardia sp. NBC_01730]|uniref:group I truncated hemoglobin n=1 Tax=Nocardia sp. NBC_01730 TaxID=2975998 RepID=UPI002E162C16|nr:group 1 truncated hemoglobin [Nocardia sp. NBC_01730]